MALPGASPAKKKDGSIYYRASVTYQSRHISLGSYESEHDASLAYEYASHILRQGEQIAATEDFTSAALTKRELPHYDTYKKGNTILSFDKWIMLHNLRDNGIYCRNPIYLQKKYFLYYLDPETTLKFDIDDLFYYMNHRISKRGGHLFVSEYGMQINIMARYGIKNFAVCDRDYRFVNGDYNDFGYRNIEIINHYHGVTKEDINGHIRYTAKIHIHGDYIIGRYSSDIHAAIAYNKASQILKEKGVTKNFPENYIDSLNEIEYAKIYNSVRIATKIREFVV